MYIAANSGQSKLPVQSARRTILFCQRYKKHEKSVLMLPLHFCKPTRKYSFMLLNSILQRETFSLAYIQPSDNKEGFVSLRIYPLIVRPRPMSISVIVNCEKYLSAYTRCDHSILFNFVNSVLLK